MLHLLRRLHFRSNPFFPTACAGEAKNQNSRKAEKKHCLHNRIQRDRKGCSVKTTKPSNLCWSPKVNVDHAIPETIVSPDQITTGIISNLPLRVRCFPLERATEIIHMDTSMPLAVCTAVSKPTPK